MTLRRNSQVSPTKLPQNHHWVFWAAYHYLYRVSWVTLHHCDRHFSGLGAGDSLLDFGCGTGETTIAMAQVWLHHCHQHHHYHWHHHHLHRHHHCEQGVLGKLGNPSTVLGVDISDEMISHCSNHYNGQENLSFQVVFLHSVWKPLWLMVAKSYPISCKTLDVSSGSEFCKANESSFNMASKPWPVIKSHEIPNKFTWHQTFPSSLEVLPT